MTADRAIEILTPGRARYSPAEYEKALELAREALRYWAATSLAPALMDARRKEE